MFVEQEQREFLDGLQVGDLVCVGRWNDWIVSAVTRMEVEQRKEQAARQVLLAGIEPVLRSAPLHVLEQVRTLLAQPPEVKR